jgi:L-arabinokinase
VPSVFFYISGHGFGHASREIEVINALAPHLPSAGLVVRSAASRWLFDRTARPPLTLIEGPSDTGVVQIDSVRLDEEATIRAAAAFHLQLPRLVAAEVEHLRRHDARLVISDAPPLACAAAAAYGIPSIVLSNFTWDWIYQAYNASSTSAPELIPIIQRAYGTASEAWRLPLHGGFETFSRVVDVPFVARHASCPRDEVRHRLGLPRDALLALFSFGGYGLQDFDPARLDCTDHWQVVLTGRRRHAFIGRGVHFVDENAVYDAGMRYEDLVAAVDVVVTKPGYGIISECIANGTPMLYTSRGNFAEYDVMVEQMPRFIRCEYIELEALLAGRWLESLERLHRKPPAPEHPETNGADVVAEMIAGMLSRC